VVSKNNTKRILYFGVVLAASIVSTATSWADKSQPTKNERLVALQKDAEFHLHPVTGKTRFIGVKNKKTLTPKNGKTKAHTISETYGPAFGLSKPVEELKLKRKTHHKNAATTYRYQQVYKGIPVIGAELVAGVDELNQVSYVSGETALNLSLNVVPTLTAEQAKNISLNAVSKWYRGKADNLSGSVPELSIYRAELLSPNTFPETLVWKVAVTAEQINELIFVDANSGSIIFHLNQIHSALNLNTFSANNTNVYQATLICTESDLACSTGDADAKAAHTYAADTYNFYSSRHGRDGIDNAGGEIISSVHVGVNLANAAWTGTQIIYGDNFPQADDVVAHELTHGVTENESNLFYYYQSGAINESFSDIWGEFVDQTNTGGTDNASAKWLMGEDIPGIGAIRNMKDPTAFSDPDKMTSANYFTSSQDNGGVHINSGVNNKAAYLMTDGTTDEPGGTFNGQTITGMGIDKVAKLYYEVQVNHLTSGSDYLDLYNALVQACSDLVTATTLTTLECAEVQKALTAVEMNEQPVLGFNPEASFCSTGTTQNTIVFTDDIDSGLSNWSFTHNNSLTNKDWVDFFTVSPSAPYATSNKNSLYGENISSISDQYAQISVTIPTLPVLEKAFLYFKHAFDLEGVEMLSQNAYYDGAVLEYSTNSGTSWVNAINLIVDGKSYTGEISNNFTNPLAGQLAFSARSNGFVSTRVNLSSFTGQTILLRWRVATDVSVSAFGWVVDDVSVYTCQGSTNSLPVARAGNDVSVNSGSSVFLNASSSSDADAAIASYSWLQVGGAVVTVNNATSATPSLTAAGGGGILAFKVTVTDSDGQEDSDIVNVIVNSTPVASAGTDISADGGNTVSLDSSSSIDADGTIVSYLWTQTSGDTVALSSRTSAAPSFVAPDSNQVLTFSLVITDNDGATSLADTVNVTVTARRSFSSSGGGGGGCSLNSNAEFNPFMFILLLGLSIFHFRKKLRIKK